MGAHPFLPPRRKPARPMGESCPHALTGVGFSHDYGGRDQRRRSPVAEAGLGQVSQMVRRVTRMAADCVFRNAAAVT